ncbi:MAG: murein biosynthesis integral membrane protein MurJ, partial [Verrucomicrobiota bacterium]
AIGTLIGGFLQLVVQFPSLYRVGFRPRLDFNWRDEGVSTVLRIMGPAVIAASAVQVNVMVNTSFATNCIPGSVVWLNNAFRLMQLPLGIFGVAIGTVTLPLLSKSIALGLGDEFRATLARGMRLAFLLTVPASIGLIMLARPIMSVVYEHGNVTSLQVEKMAEALQLYAIGLAAYSVMKVLVPAFYAIDRRKTPMIVSFLAIGTNLLMNWIFTFQLGWGHRGLAFSTSLVATINFLILYALMHQHAKGLETRRMFVCLGKIAVAGVLLALVCWLGNSLAAWGRMNLIVKVGALVLTIATAAGVFFGTALALRIEEIQDVQRLVARKLGRR